MEEHKPQPDALLAQTREQIDEINKEMLRLFTRRMELSARVAEIKRQAGAPVFMPAREEQILDDMARRAGENFAGYARTLFSVMMDLSKDYQSALLGRGNAFRLEELTAPEALIPGRVCCQGVEGAYSAQAARRLFGGEQALSFCPDFEGVFLALERGEADYGVVPVENSTAGSVTAVYDLLIKYRFQIVSGCSLPVRHCLLGTRDATPEGVAQVWSHPQGLSQCSAFLREQGLIQRPCRNTAEAARDVARLGDPGVAAIGSAENARLYGLKILRDDICNNPYNRTRFVGISRSPVIEADADKISIVVALPHRIGSLQRALSRLAANGLNLTKLETCPIEGRVFEYLFYMDFTGSVREERTANLLASLREQLDFFAFLGNYRDIKYED